MGGRGAFSSAISRAMSSLQRWRDRRVSRLTEAGRTGSERGVSGRRPGVGVGADRVRMGRGGREGKVGRGVGAEERGSRLRASCWSSSQHPLSLLLLKAATATAAAEEWITEDVYWCW